MKSRRSKLTVVVPRNVVGMTRIDSYPRQCLVLSILLYCLHNFTLLLVLGTFSTLENKL